MANSISKEYKPMRFDTVEMAKEYLEDRRPSYEHGCIFVRVDGSYGILLHHEGRYLSSFLPSASSIVVKWRWINENPEYQETNTIKDDIDDIKSSNMPSDIADILQQMLFDEQEGK